MKLSGRIATALVLTCFFPWILLSQTAQNRWATEFGGGMARYVSFPGQAALNTQQFQPVYSFAATRYLAGAFDFRTKLSFGSNINFPTSIDESQQTNLMDMSYQMMFKFNNGAFLKERAFIGPYLLFGIGGSVAAMQPDAYVPLGGGIRFRMGERFGLKLESVRKFSLNREAQTLTHALAFVYNLGGKKKDETPRIEEATDNEAILAAIMPGDRDQDGIIDQDDQCPDVYGVWGEQGCPEKQRTGIAGTEEVEVFAEKPVDPLPQPVNALVVTQEKESNALIDYQSDLNALISSDEQSGSTEATEANIQPLLVDQPEARIDKTNAPCAFDGINNDFDAILFDQGMHDLPESSLQGLDAIAEKLKQCGHAKLVLEGHADATGGQNDNLVLSVMRAYHIKYYLVYEHGISQQRILSRGLGEDQPVANNETDTGRERNRRVDIFMVF
ncbi:MAG: OmpA family protein [Bacteroidota bacterium]